MAKLVAQSGTTVVRQVADHVRLRILREQLKRGAPLPSYRELAAELGVAYLTVKRGIDELVAEGVIHQQHGRGTFVAKELACAPQALQHLGVIFPSSRDLLVMHQYIVEIMRGVAAGAPAQADTHIFSLRQDGMVRATHLGEWAVNGVILLGVENDDYLRAFAQWGTPGVVVDYYSQAAPLDYVACDNRAAARQLVAYLAAQGHRRVAYASHSSPQRVARPDNEEATLLVRDSSDSRERRDESVNALRERGMLLGVWTLPKEEKGEWATPAPEDLFGRIGSAGGATALVTDSNYGLPLLLKELARRGLRVPQDVSVCAVASDKDATFEDRRLTCCRFDFLGMGRKAIELLSERCRKPGLDKARAHRIGFKFVEGETAGRVNLS